MASVYRNNSSFIDIFPLTAERLNVAVSDVLFQQKITQEKTRLFFCVAARPSRKASANCSFSDELRSNMVTVGVFIRRLSRYTFIQKNGRRNNFNPTEWIKNK
jgi:hypothetical protein